MHFLYQNRIRGLNLHKNNALTLLLIKYQIFLEISAVHAFKEDSLEINELLEP